MTAALTETVTITNRRGLHARAAAKFVKCVTAFNVQMDVRKDDVSVTATSIMGLMMLAAGKGATLEIIAAGPDAEKALKAVVQLITDRFDEDE